MRIARLVLVLLVVVTFLTVPAAAQEAEDSERIASLLDQMEEAVLNQDRDTYLSYVEQSDPVFALEHRRWADDWTERSPVDLFKLHLENLNVEGENATADLTMRWSLRDNPRNQEASLKVQFRRDDQGNWLFAGEYWYTLENEHFRVHAAPGLEDLAETVLGMMPEIYAYATDHMDFEPEGLLEIKLYRDGEALVAMTLLSLPRIAGWNEPGEALKLVGRLSGDSEGYLKTVLTHEFTHMLSFEMANESHGNNPWWLEEGIAEYISSTYWSEGRQDYTVNEVREYLDDGKLAPWDQISDFNNTPEHMWQYVYPQGYVFVRYVTESYGEERRNEWLSLIATEMPLPEATLEVFQITFEELDASFQAWLAEQ